MSTSQAALDSIQPHAAGLREQIVEFIKQRGGVGATCDEVERWLNLRHQTASARIYELAGKGKKPRPAKIETIRCRAGGAVRRETRSGRLAHVWVVKPDVC